MAKKQITTVLKTSDEIVKKEYVGIVSNNAIKFIDDDIIVSLNWHDDILTMTRENDQYQLTMNFIADKKTKGIYLLKQEQVTLDLDIVTDKLIIDDRIQVQYSLDGESKEYVITIGSDI